MKKFISLMLTLALIFSLSISVFAEGDEDLDKDNTSGQTKLSFNVDPTYEITIPETIELKEKTEDSKITYEQDAVIKTNGAVRLEKRQEIQIELQCDYELEVSPDTEYKLPYTVAVGDTNILPVNPLVAKFGTDKEEQSVTLHFEAQDPDYAGKYEDTVTFTIKVSTQSDNQ